MAIRGAVQGVGFRPFVYRIARELRLAGWVTNSSHGVFVEAEGDPEDLTAFLLLLERDRPPRSYVQSLEHSYLDPAGYTGFEIRPSERTGDSATLILPDIATCPDCLRELFDPADRRYRYPFINCTHCGPRFTIIEKIPYDRENTSMKIFRLCDRCRREYLDPEDRRFHAQPIACPVCGPHLDLWNGEGDTIAREDPALLEGAEIVRRGGILALKGIGGFHLVADAGNSGAVEQLRLRKHREEKPFALMYPSLEAVRSDCEVSPLESRLLGSPEAPIVLLRRKNAQVDGPSGISAAVAPGNPFLGVMLPYSPLHHLLMRELGIAIVATSGNFADEPICTDEHDALKRLGGLADAFLVHNRPIVRHADDSIVRLIAGREMVIRRARGYAPLPVPVPSGDHTVRLAVGAQLKNSVALLQGQNAFVGQHIGDLDTPEAFGAFQSVCGDLQRLYSEAQVLVCDQHPDYLSTVYARGKGKPFRAVQHHYAHLAACMAENELDGELLGVVWDGTGYSPDGTVWGGEFLRTTDEGFERVACLRTFPLPGGDRAIRETRRSALGLLFEALGSAAFEHDLILSRFTPAELTARRSMLASGLNTHRTSSMGRLFDGVASLIGLRQENTFEGQAAMALEYLAVDTDRAAAYPAPVPLRSLPAESGHVAHLDWQPLVMAIVEDVHAGVAPQLISAGFHNALVEMLVGVARSTGLEKVVLSGGCFQNRYLAEHSIRRLEQEGFRPYWHQRIPPNDGGIALGQLYADVRRSGGARNSPGKPREENS